MAYRDDLEAAQVRIEALEAQLAAAENLEGRSLLARAQELERRLSEVRGRTRELVEAHERVIAAMRPVDDVMPTLVDHNRSIPTKRHGASGAPSGVCCPWCGLLGDRIEMRIGGSVRAVFAVEEAGIVRADDSVRCPRCSYFGLKSK